MIILPLNKVVFGYYIYFILFYVASIYDFSLIFGINVNSLSISSLILFSWSFFLS